MAVQNFRVRHSVDILGNSLNTTSTTFNLLNTTSTTLNIGGAATTINFGADNGTMTIRSSTIVGTGTTQTLFDTGLTTINAFGAATTINFGADNGTMTIRSSTITGTGTTQTLFNTGLTTINAFGAATSLNLGSTTGTATLRNPTLVGTQTTQNVYNTVATTVNAFGEATSLTFGANNSGTTTVRSSTTAVQNALTVGSTATVTTSTTSPIIQGSTSASGFLTIRSTESATKSTAGVRLTENIASTSPTTGTLVVTGGVGIGGSLNVAGDITADGDIFIKAKDGTGGTITLGQGADDSVNIQADISSSLIPDAANQDIGSSTKTWRNLWLNGTANIPTLSVSGNSTLTGSLTANGNVTLGDASADTITVNGTPTFNTAVTISGSNNLTVGGDVVVSGGDIISPTLGSTCTVFNTNTATLNIGGVATVVNIGASNGLTNIKHSLRIDKDLEVLGTLNYLGQPTWTEKVIVLRGVSGSGSDTDANEGGVILKGTTNKEILWSDLNDAWTFNQNIYPKTNNLYNLGSDTLRFNTGYFTSLVGNLTGNASTATALLNARTINGVSFDGTSNISFSTSNVSEGTNLYYTDERVDDRVNSLIIAGTGVQKTYDDSANTYTLALDFTEFSTTNITEGTNLYYTDSRSRSAISVTDSGGDGSLSYNSSTGVITYTGPSSTEVRSHFTGGTGISIVNGDISLDFTEFSTTNITEGTNLYFTNSRSRSAISVSGSLSYDNTTGVISYTTPTTSGITEGTNLYYTDERVDDRVNSLIIAGTGVQKTYDDSANTYTLALDFTEFSTTNITEGTNLYFTNSRSRSAISVSGSLSYNSETGVISYTTPTTDGIIEGSNNLYYTSTRVNNAIDSRVTSTFINNLSGVISDQVSFVTVPSTSTSTGTVGQLAQDNDYLYVCVATDSWKRIAWDTNVW